MPYNQPQPMYQSSSVNPSKKKTTIIILLMILLLLLIFGIILFFVLRDEEPTSNNTTLQPTVTPYILSDNAQVFDVSGTGDYPVFNKIYVDPFIGRAGDNQKLVIDIDEGTNPAMSAFATVEDDYGKKNISLAMSQRQGTLVSWQADWTIQQVQDKEYQITFILIDKDNVSRQMELLWNGQSSTTSLAPLKKIFSSIYRFFSVKEVYAEWVDTNTSNATSSGAFPHKGDVTLNPTTNIIPLGPNIITGVDNGNFTIAAGKTLQLNQNTTFVINQGNQIINQGGNISKASGVIITHGYLWAKDVDNDGCFVGPVQYSTTTVANVSWGAGYRRVKDMNYSNDPDDNSPGAAPGCAVSLYTLTVSKTGNGTIQSGESPKKIDCGTICSASYSYNATVVLTANADTGYTFTGWSGSGCSGIGTCTILMDGAKTITATFTISSSCNANGTNQSTNLCSTVCGASSDCENKSPLQSWTVSNTCYWCNSNCLVNNQAKPASYVLEGGVCKYNCSVNCATGGWSRSGCSSTACPPDASGNNCYYSASCGTLGCAYITDINKQCTTSVCEASGWDNTSCTIETFDFLLAFNPASATVTKSASGNVTATTTVVATLISGTTQSVNFMSIEMSAGNTWPEGVQVNNIAGSCNPTCNKSATFTIPSTAPTGTYTFKIDAVSGTIVKTAQFNLTINAAAPTGCAWTPCNPYTAGRSCSETKTGSAPYCEGDPIAWESSVDDGMSFCGLGEVPLYGYCLGKNDDDAIAPYGETKVAAVPLPNTFPISTDFKGRSGIYCKFTCTGLFCGADGCGWACCKSGTFTITSMTISVYDLSDHLVFNTTVNNTSSYTWTGKDNSGKNLANGTYYYITDTTSDYGTYSYKNQVSITRNPLSVTISGSGSVTSNPADMSCTSGTCTSHFGTGSSVTLTASPTPGNSFNSWSGCPNPSGNICTVQMDTAKSVTATFSTTAPTTYTLSVTKTGTGTVTGTGINCGSDCSENYNSGTSVTLTAVAGSGYTFSSWSGCTSSSGTRCDVTMNSTKTVRATFTQSCSCTGWNSYACAGGGCLTTQRYQARTCTPSGCEAEYQCVTDPTCSTATWYPCTPTTCTGSSSCGYFKTSITRTCPTGKTIVTGKCVAMPNNHIDFTYKSGNGWYCQTDCDGAICFTTDGCLSIQCQ